MSFRNNKIKVLGLVLATSIIAESIPVNIYAKEAYSFNIQTADNSEKVLEESVEEVIEEEKKEESENKETSKELVENNEDVQEIIYETDNKETLEEKTISSKEDNEADSDILDNEDALTEAEDESEIVENNDDEIIDVIKEIYEDAYMYDDDTLCITLDDGEKIYTDKDDPGIFKHFMEEVADEDDLMANEYYADGKSTVSPFTKKTYSHDAKFSNHKILNGIDVSQWNGTIDWEKAKASGVDFAFIRIGYRGYGEAGNIPEAGDKNGVNNIKAAYKAGVKVGVYFFSQAISVAEGKQEADFCLNYIKKNNLAKYISLPVIIDYEYYTDKIGRLWNAHLNATEHQAICDSFAGTIHAGGMKPGVYANYSMLKDDMHPSRSAEYTKYWIARWNTYTGYTGNYNFWQYTDNGSVPGISGAVDCDYYYEEITKEEPSEKPVEITYTLHAPNKTTYNVSDKINLAGAYLMSSQNEKIAVTSSMISGFSSEQAGVKTVNVNYKDKAYSFDVLVNDFDLRFDAMFGSTLGDIELPEVSYGVLSFKKPEKTPVGAVGTNKFTVSFEPTDARFSKSDVSSYVNVKYSIGDGVNETADVVVYYNDQLAVNKTKASKVINSVKHKKTLKKGTDYSISVSANVAFDENGNALRSGMALESEMIPKGYSGTFKVIITASGNYLGKIEKDVYVSEKGKLLKNSLISLGSKLKNINFSDYDEAMFIPAVYDAKLKKYFKVENGEITDIELTKDEVQYAFTVKLSNKYLVMGKDFEVVSYGSHYVGNQSFAINGINGYLGVKKVSFKITGKALTASKVNVEGIENKIYDGTPKVNDDVIITYVNTFNALPVTLVKDRDYAITYSDNTNPGTAKMYITGLASGGYSGKILKSFKILDK